MPIPSKLIRYPPQQITSKRGWKDHPLIVAVIAAASTAVFFMTVVVPLRVDLLTSKVERLTSTATEAVATAEKLEKAEKALAEARSAQKLATQRNPFAGRSVYPIGLDRAVLGTPVNAVLERYPSGKWDEDSSYYSVANLENSVVREAVFYFDGKGDKRVVRSVLFFFAGVDNISDEIVYKHFLSTFGEPIKGKRKAILWKATDREWVVQRSIVGTGSTYGVYPAGSTLDRDGFDNVGKK